MAVFWGHFRIYKNNTDMKNNSALTTVMDGLMRRYSERVPDVKKITQALVSQGIITNESDIEKMTKAEKQELLDKMIENGVENLSELGTTDLLGADISDTDDVSPNEP